MGMKPLEVLWEPKSSCSDHGRGVGQCSLELRSARSWLFARSAQTRSTLHHSASLAWRVWWGSYTAQVKGHLRLTLSLCSVLYCICLYLLHPFLSLCLGLALPLPISPPPKAGEHLLALLPLSWQPSLGSALPE